MNWWRVYDCAVSALIGAGAVFITLLMSDSALMWGRLHASVSGGVATQRTACPSGIYMTSVGGIRRIICRMGANDSGYREFGIDLNDVMSLEVRP